MPKWKRGRPGDDDAQQRPTNNDEVEFAFLLDRKFSLPQYDPGVAPRPGGESPAATASLQRGRGARHQRHAEDTVVATAPPAAHAVIDEPVGPAVDTVATRPAPHLAATPHPPEPQAVVRPQPNAAPPAVPAPTFVPQAEDRDVLSAPTFTTQAEDHQVLPAPPISPATPVPLPESVPVNSPHERNIPMTELNVALKDAMEIDGALGVALVDSASGLALASAGDPPGINLHVAAAGNSNVVQAKLRTMRDLGLTEKIEDVLITLDTQYHLIRMVHGAGDGLFIYLVLDKTRGNLAMARFKLTRIEGNLEI